MRNPLSARGHRRRVQKLVEQGNTLYARGEVSGAVDCYQQACALTREAAEAEPGDPDHVQQLGSMLYTLGQWQMEQAALREAIDSLTEAESTYERLAGLPGQPAERLIADVVIRRARAHAEAGHPASAIVDTQRAVLTYVGKVNDDPGLTDAARVLSWAAHVQLMIGADPDLAVAAADWALSTYLRGYQVGDQIELSGVHLAPIRAAARTAHAIHTAFDRPDLARAAGWLAESFAGGAPDPHDRLVAELRETSVTFAGVLQELDPDLGAQLTAPTIPLTPVLRCGLQLAPSIALRLATLVKTEIGRGNTAGGLLLAMEAHAMFAGASQAQTMNMRYQFDRFGFFWAQILRLCGEQWLAAGRPAAAVDAAGWVTGVVSQLFPHAMADRSVRAEALACTRWQEELFTSTGDRKAAEEVAAATRMLESFGARDGE